ncbi:hypothetical protein ABZ341_24070 [Streptomyces sp. NPDC006173]|uniref:hypothetical protein n=1 Tax=Streptomyces sp. NPDC006173 TaxID=3155349 RepID=UPI0033F91EAB
MRTPLISAAITAAMITALASLSPASAVADDTGAIACHGGTLNLRFDPGISFSRKTSRLLASGEVGLCNSAKYPAITGGTIRIEAVLTGACPGPVGPGYAKVTINWNNGSTSVIQQSTFRGDASSYSLEGGHVAAGPFAEGTTRANGRTTTNLVEIGTSCASGGLTNYTATIDAIALGDI